VANPGYDPYRTVVHEDPHPTYGELRKECPVYHNEDLGFWALFRHDDVRAASRDWETFTSTHGTFLEAEYEAMREFIPQEGKFQDHDPPSCTALRGVVKDRFLHKAIAPMESNIRAVVVELIDAIDGRTHADFVEEFAEPFPVRIISDMLGLPRPQHAQMSEWSHKMFEREDGRATPEAYDAGNALRDFLWDISIQRREHPTDDLMSLITHAEIEGVPLTKMEILGIAMFLYVAGNETTTALLGNALITLNEYPDKRAQLIEDPSLIPAAIEEFLRLEAPVPQQGRVTTRDVEIHGTTIPKGEMVLLMYASANRDAEAFKTPDAFDPDRTESSRHMSFGEGVHFCLGAHLARLEARVALEELLARFPNYQIDGEVEWYMASALRGPVHLPVKL